MFVYCLNNPVKFIDKGGKSAEALQWWSGGMWWLCGVDFALPIGDIIYAGGIIVLGAIAVASGQGSTPEIVFDETDTAYGSPSPNNNDDDDDDDDDYYADDSNFAGRERIGKSKGKTPRNNQAQNKQFRDATRGLSKAARQKVHKAISQKGGGFHDIVDIVKELFIFALGLFALDE